MHLLAKTAFFDLKSWSSSGHTLRSSTEEVAYREFWEDGSLCANMTETLTPGKFNVEGERGLGNEFIE